MLSGGHTTIASAFFSGTRFALPLVWFLGVLVCPAQISQVFLGSGAAFFVGAFVLGALVTCVFYVGISMYGNPVTPLAGALRFALPIGVAATTAWYVGAGPVPEPLAACMGGLCGVGGGAALLATARRTSSGANVKDGLLMLATAVLGAALLVVPILIAGQNLPLLWAYLCFLALGSAVLSQGRNTPASVSGTDSNHAVRPLAVLRAGLWEPSLGLGLSLMSTLLPWGAFMSGGAASTPSAWTFAAGIAAAGLLCLAACRAGVTKAPFGMAVHVAMPVLAAAVVGLRMLGDTGSPSAVLDAVRGVASGATAAFFFVFAWLAMVYSSRSHGGSTVPFAVGLSLAFAVGAVILPLHVLNQSVASFMAPVLSLVFLVVASCSSLEHLGHRGQADVSAHVAPGPLSVEEAAARLAAERGLSPRETEMLVRLASGRSAEGIAEVLGISPNTVRAHVRNIHEKLQVSSRDQVVDAIEAARTRG